MPIFDPSSSIYSHSLSEPAAQQGMHRRKVEALHAVISHPLLGGLLPHLFHVVLCIWYFTIASHFYGIVHMYSSPLEILEYSEKREIGQMKLKPERIFVYGKHVVPTEEHLYVLAN